MWDAKYDNTIWELLKYSTLGYDRFLTFADSGNVSCRCGEEVLITAGGASLRSINRNELLLVDIDGNVLYNPSGFKPSKEIGLHLSVYRCRKDVNCIFHVHPPYSTAFAVRGMTVPLLTTTSERKLKKVPLIPYAVPGSRMLAKYVTEAVADTENASVRALVLEKHGIITYGATLEESFNSAELLETTARIAIYSKVID
ncbi:MAG: class II aldolase/adducin family protein [Syntrophaceae bacterium]|nr:class II aldolase/adducin family protein [Syntrophaceae bacterium]